MPKACVICGKTSISGTKYKRRGMIRRKGGAGAKIVGKSFRRFNPNLQKVRIRVNGGAKRSNVCTKCLKAGKVVKASR